MRELCALLLLLPVTAEAGRKKARAPEPEPPPPLADPSPPDGSAGPYDDRVPAPVLDGSTTELALETLTVSSVHFDLGADLGALQQITGEAADNLRAGLAAASGWRVTWGPTGVVGHLRDGGPPEVARGGTHNGDAGCWRIAVHLDAPPAAANGGRDVVTRVDAANGATFRLDGFTSRAPPCPDQLATALLVEGPIALEVYEAGDDSSRPHTVRALQLAQIQLGNHAMVGAVGVRPHASGAADAPVDLEVTSPAAGLLDIRGTANPAAAGWSWVRILGPDGQPWEEAAVRVGTAERIGWSADPGQRYWLQGSFPVPEGPGFEGRLELWFAADGGAPVRVYDGIVAVPDR